MLKERINHEFISAFKSKNTFRKDTIGGLKAKITEAEKKKNNVELNDEDIYGVISTMIKQREQAIEVYSKNDSEQAKLNAQKEVDEIEILKEFMPVQMSEVEIENIVCNFIIEYKENPKSLMSVIMKIFNSNYKGKYDNKKLKEIVDKQLQS